MVSGCMLGLRPEGSEKGLFVMLVLAKGLAAGCPRPPPPNGVAVADALPKGLLLFAAPDT